VLPAKKVVRPLGQGVQLEAPATAEKKPCGHSAQAAPAAANDPAAHATQPAALDVPGLVTAPLRPGPQIVQAATVALPVDGVEMPVGQAVQPAALAVPGLVTEP